MSSRGTTASSTTPDRSLSSLNAHTDTTVEATSDRYSMNSLSLTDRARRS